MSYGVFFCIEAIGRTVDSAAPEVCSGIDTIIELLSSLSVEGDFFGLIDSRNRCLQVRFEDNENRYWLEVPRPDLSGSYGAHFSFDEASKVFEELPDLIPERGFSRFEFLSW